MLNLPTSSKLYLLMELAKRCKQYEVSNNQFKLAIPQIEQEVRNSLAFYSNDSQFDNRLNELFELRLVFENTTNFLSSYATLYPNRKIRILIHNINDQSKTIINILHSLEVNKQKGTILKDLIEQNNTVLSNVHKLQKKSDEMQSFLQDVGVLDDADRSSCSLDAFFDIFASRVATAPIDLTFAKLKARQLLLKKENHELAKQNSHLKEKRSSTEKVIDEHIKEIANIKELMDQIQCFFSSSANRGLHEGHEKSLDEYLQKFEKDKEDGVPKKLFKIETNIQENILQLHQAIHAQLLENKHCEDNKMMVEDKNKIFLEKIKLYENGSIADNHGSNKLNKVKNANYSCADLKRHFCTRNIERGILSACSEENLKFITEPRP